MIKKLKTTAEGYEGQIKILVNLVNALNDKIVSEERFRQKEREYQREAYEKEKYFNELRGNYQGNSSYSPRNSQQNFAEYPRNQYFGLVSPRADI